MHSTGGLAGGQGSWTLGFSNSKIGAGQSWSPVSVLGKVPD